jgi:hypothetical protein
MTAASVETALYPAGYSEDPAVTRGFPCFFVVDRPWSRGGALVLTG